MKIACRANRGFTLAELLVASAVAIVVAIGIGTMEGGRSEMEREVIRRSGLTSEQAQVALATVQLSERIAKADWVTIDNTLGIFRFRIPSGCLTPACLDNLASYQWDQYRLQGGILRLYRNTGAGCGSSRAVARDVTGMSLTQSANEVAYTLTWDNGHSGARNRTHQFRGRVASRALASPGDALAPNPGPPGAC